MDADRIYVLQCCGVLHGANTLLSLIHISSYEDDRQSGLDNFKLLVAMRFWETPVHIPNTMVTVSYTHLKESDEPVGEYEL